ncbi:Hypothetical predicted protein [Pelobates cultripes]|uniref:Uncharacterized protein n=1 Tax=Pelobates cultripes TaxID=61616 RepID=A0AAD1T6Y1_PELCU|nr:Hypothetical predicted protein [Pelobates cultripes]
MAKIGEITQHSSIPFFHKSRPKRWRKQPAAYHHHSRGQLELLGPPSPWNTLEPETILCSPPDQHSTMGQGSQKPPPSTPQDAQDIWALLERQAQNKMVTQETWETVVATQNPEPDTAQNTLHNSEEQAPNMPDWSTLATKQDIKDLQTDSDGGHSSDPSGYKFLLTRSGLLRKTSKM